MFSTLLIYKYLFFAFRLTKKDLQNQLKCLDLNFVKIPRSVVEIIAKGYYNDDYGSDKLYTKNVPFQITHLRGPTCEGCQGTSQQHRRQCSGSAEGCPWRACCSR